MKQVGVAFGATTEDINAMSRDARIQQLAAIDGGQIDAPGLFPAKLTRYVRAYFIAALANARPNRGVHVVRCRAIEPVHFFQRAHHNTRRRSTPSGMHRSHGMLSRISQQYGITIRGANRYRNARERGYQSIAFTGASNLVPEQHDSRVNLFQTRHAVLRDGVAASAESMIEPLQLGEQWRIQHASQSMARSSSSERWRVF